MPARGIQIGVIKKPAQYLVVIPACLSSLNVLHPCRRALAAITTHKPQKRFSALPKRKTGKPLRIALRNSDDKEPLIQSEIP